MLSGNLSVEDLEEVEREYNELLDMEAEELKLPDVPPHEPNPKISKFSALPLFTSRYLPT